MNDADDPARTKFTSIHKDELLEKLQKAIEALCYVEPIVRDAGHTLNLRRSWLDKILKRKEPQGLRTVKRIRETFCGFYNQIEKSDKPDPMVNCQVYILDSCDDWIGWAEELKAQKNNTVGPYR